MKPEMVYVNTGSPELKKAHAIQTFFTCKNLAKFFDVNLIYPLTLSLIPKTSKLKKQYKENNIKLILLPTTSFGRVFKSGLLFLFDKLIFSLIVFIYTLFKKTETIFTRDYVVSFCFAFFGNKKIVFEIHNLEHVIRNKSKINYFIKKMEKFALRKSDFVVAITEWMLNYVRKINRNATLIPDAFEPTIFKKVEKKKARQILKIDKKEKIALYSGLTFRYGIKDLVMAGKFLDDVKIFIIGGDERDTQKLEKLAKNREIQNVIFISKVPLERVNLYLSAADVLLLSYSSNEFTEYFSSPLKLFEYMSAKKPIVATKVGCFKGILKDRYNSILVDPGSPRALAEGIKEVIKNKKLAEKIARNAYRDSKKYTYKKRAEKIKEIIDKFL